MRQTRKPQLCRRPLQVQMRQTYPAPVHSIYLVTASQTMHRKKTQAIMTTTAAMTRSPPVPRKALMVMVTVDARMHAIGLTIRLRQHLRAEKYGPTTAAETINQTTIGVRASASYNALHQRAMPMAYRRLLAKAGKTQGISARHWQHKALARTYPIHSVPVTMYGSGGSF